MQTLENLWILFVLILALLGFGVVACLPRWLTIAAGRSLGNAQHDLLVQADIQRRAKLAEQTPPPPLPPRPSALTLVARKSDQPPS
jgi:hypothetical protein